ncbi:MAG: phosphoribosylanthranilate isomerase [Pseudomonadales bacterium]
MRDAIQIAGIHDLEEAELVIACGVEFLGFPLRLKDAREDLTEQAARTIVSAVCGRVECVAITYLADAREIAELADFLRVGWVQLHGAMASSELAGLRRIRPHLKVIKSLVVSGDDPRQQLIDQISRLCDHVDAFIADTYDPATGRSGATGKVHDWNVSRQLVAQSPKPVILAGGLRADNVATAIGQVRPAAVDAHTGVEGSGARKDSARLQAFVETARKAFGRVAVGADV